MSDEQRRYEDFVRSSTMHVNDVRPIGLTEAPAILAEAIGLARRVADLPIRDDYGDLRYEEAVRIKEAIRSARRFLTKLEAPPKP